MASSVEILLTGGCFDEHAGQSSKGGGCISLSAENGHTAVSNIESEIF